MISCYSLICGSLHERNILGCTIKVGHIDWGYYQIMCIGNSVCISKYSFSVWILFLSGHYLIDSINFQTVFHAAQDTVCPLGFQGSLLAHAEPVFYQHPKLSFPGLLLGLSSPSLCSCPALLCPRRRIWHLLLLNSMAVVFAQCSCPCRFLCKGSHPLRKSAKRDLLTL